MLSTSLETEWKDPASLKMDSLLINSSYWTILFHTVHPINDNALPSLLLKSLSGIEEVMHAVPCLRFQRFHVSQVNILRLIRYCEAYRRKWGEGKGLLFPAGFMEIYGTYCVFHHTEFFRKGAMRSGYRGEPRHIFGINESSKSIIDYNNFFPTLDPFSSFPKCFPFLPPSVASCLHKFCSFTTCLSPPPHKTFF